MPYTFFEATARRRAFFQLLCVCVCFSIVLVSCDDDEDPQPTTSGSAAASTYDGQLVKDWATLAITLTQETPGYTPPVAARSFGYLGLTAYESIVTGMSGFASLEGKAGLGGPGGALQNLPVLDAQLEYNWPTVANSALATMMTHMYVFDGAAANNAARINQLESDLDAQFAAALTIDVATRSREYGTQIANHIYDWSQSDGGHEGYLNNFPADYIPPAGDPGLWVPTPPDFSPALQPYWGQVRAFAENQTSVSSTIPIAPPTYSLEAGSQFNTELQEVFNVSQNLTQEEITIAQYWSDDPGATATPPGHSMSILVQVLGQESPNLTESTEAFAKLSLALHDAFVSCWNSKYTYNYVRPITVIRATMEGQEDWMSVVGTPPFPEYTSGHSVQSGAMTAVLTAIYGENYSFTDETHVNQTNFDGRARSFASFDEAAEEAAISRLYGGIHYRAAIDLGVTQGRQVGGEVLKLFN